MTEDFVPFPKMARWSRDVIVTEKIDGMNAQIVITESGEFLTASRTRWITPEDDNYGFSAWAYANREELLKLGVGRHFGEWWGAGIQRRYGLSEKKFSLFNASRWNSENLPACCSVVPTLYSGPMDALNVKSLIVGLEKNGSVAAPGFMDPEGLIVYHVAGGIGFKKTVKKDHQPKGFTN